MATAQPTSAKIADVLGERPNVSNAKTLGFVYIYILGLPWSIKPLSLKKSKKLFGECNSDRREIHLSEISSHEILIETLIHEVNHAIWHMMDLKEKENEERAVTRLSTGWASIYYDERNADFLKLLTK